MSARRRVGDSAEFGKVAVLMGGWVSRAFCAERLDVAPRATNARGLVRGPEGQTRVHPHARRDA